MCIFFGVAGMDRLVDVADLVLVLVLVGVRTSVDDVVVDDSGVRDSTPVGSLIQRGVLVFD